MNRIKAHKYYKIDDLNKKSITFTYNGQKIEGYENDTIVSALYAHGERIFTRSFKYHRPRGFYDYLGYGAETLMTVDGKPNILAGKTLIKEDMKVKTQNAWPSVKFDFMAINRILLPLLPNGFYYKMFYKPKWTWPFFEHFIRKAAGLGEVNIHDHHEQERYEKIYLFPEVCIIGGGVAGVLAAEASLNAGKKVMLIDDQYQLGGRSLHRSHVIKNCADNELVEKQEGEAIQIVIDRIKKHKNLTILQDTIVFAVYEDNLVAAKKNNDFYKIRAEKVIVTTGATDRHLVFENNDIPGVVQGSAVEKLVALHAIKPAQQAVVITCHDGGYHTALMLLEAGVSISAVVDNRNGEITGEYYNLFKEKGIRIQQGQTIHKANGSKALYSIEIGSDSGKGESETIRCDMAVIAVGYKPTIQILSMGNKGPKWNKEKGVYLVDSLPSGVYAAGDVNGYGTFETIYTEVHHVVEAVIHSQEQPATPRNTDEVISVLPADIEASGKNHFIDKCMDVTRNELQSSIKEGFDQVELLKRYTSMGMGPGQGKSSFEAVARLSAQDTNLPPDNSAITTVRPPFVPISFASLAGRSHHLVPIRRTILHGLHEEKNAKFLVAGLWKRPEYYQSVEEEVLNVRHNLGMIDISTLGALEVTGKDAIKLLNFMMAGKYDKLKVGRIRYSVMIAESGIVFEDGTVSHISENVYYISTTTGNQDAIYSQFKLWIETDGYDAKIRNVSSAYSAISIAGPKSRDFLQKLISTDISKESFPYMHCISSYIKNVPVRVLRVGFTGELGYEIHFPSEFGESIWNLFQDEGKQFNIMPFGVEAQRILRLEKGHLIPGVDTDALTSPFDASLDFAVKDDKEDYIGKQFYNEFKNKDFKNREKLVPFKLDDNAAIPEDGVAVLHQGKIAGRVTSARYSPTLKVGIGLAFVKTPLANVNDKIHIKTETGRDVYGTIIDHALYDPEGERLKI